ncbi:hypothetical protein [Raoultella terrigena]|uniref:hypothetical protein n=1 Tax=Raoultella terrigena TaxID=577 RepID=UPI003892657E
MKKLKVEKAGCWGMVDGVFQQLQIGHEFVAVDIPAAFVGRVSVVSEVEEQTQEEKTLEVATPGDDAAEQAEQQDESAAKSKKAK